jgi:hypothetical protein
MTDFRHADNPEPFTQMHRERAVGALTAHERGEVRHGLAELQRRGSRLYGEVGDLDRGAVASDLRHLMEICMRMQGCLKLFPDKPEESP